MIKQTIGMSKDEINLCNCQRIPHVKLPNEMHHGEDQRPDRGRQEEGH